MRSSVWNRGILRVRDNPGPSGPRYTNLIGQLLNNTNGVKTQIMGP